MREWAYIFRSKERVFEVLKQSNKTIRETGKSSDTTQTSRREGAFRDKHTARQDKYRIRQLNDRKAPQVEHVHGVTRDAHDRRHQRQTIDEQQRRLDQHDGVDEARQEALGRDRVLFDELREVVQARGDGEGEEGEAQREAEVAYQGQDPHYFGQ